MKKLIMTMGVAAMVLAGCSQSKEAGKPAIDLANFDNTVAAGEDFYQYACGGWMAANPLTPEYARYGIFDQLDKENQERLKSLIEELNATAQETGSVGEKIQIMYALGLDTAKLNADGAAPVQGQIAAIKAVANNDELASMIATLFKQGVRSYFGMYIDADEKNSSMNLLQFSQGGLSMGDRDYYLLDDATSVKIRTAYKEYMNKLFALAGYSEADAAASTDAVLALETEIAKISVDRGTLRDVHKNYNKMPLKDFVKKYNFINWDIYMKEVGIKNSTEVNASQVTFFASLTKLLKNVPLDTQKEYLVFKLLNSASNYLSEDFVNANFEFYGKTVQGREMLQPVWKRSLSVVNRTLSEALGQKYVEKYFPASSKEKMLEMVANLRVALGERINALEWMTDETKAKAQEKLGTFIVKVGYPDTWKDYSALDIQNDSYWANMCRASEFRHNDMMEMRASR